MKLRNPLLFALLVLALAAAQPAAKPGVVKRPASLLPGAKK